MRKILILMTATVLILSVAGGFASSSSENKVPVLVGFKGVPDSGLIERLGGTVGVKFEYMPVIAARLPPAVIDILKKNPMIEYIEEDAIAYAIPITTQAQTTDWGVNTIGAPETEYNGSGVTVAILDTGIQKHEDLNIAGGVYYATSLSWYDGSTSYSRWKDRYGHGTHVAGIVAALNNTVGVRGVAPNASIYAVKVLNDQGWGYYSDVIQGYEWAKRKAQSGAKVVATASLGGSSDSTSLHNAIINAKRAGVTLVAAAGNEGSSGLSYPAKYPEVISVGATDSRGNIASFSSRGPELDVSAPGVSINSTYKSSIDPSRSYATLSGTSMAAPHVAGTIALMLQKNSSRTPDDIQTILQNTAVDISLAGFDTNSGYGRINAVAAVAAS